MVNIFSEIEDEVLFNDNLMFDEEKIKEFVYYFLNDKIMKIPDSKRPFYFEDIIYDFFEYINLKIIKTKKTRDFGLDGIIKINLDIFGDISLGLQIKYKTIDSKDVDEFLSSLKRAEIQLGVIVCKDSRNLDNYKLENKLKAILLSKGIKVKERLMKENVDINPVIILKFENIVDIVTSNMRMVVRGIYKK